MSHQSPLTTEEAQQAAYIAAHDGAATIAEIWCDEIALQTDPNGDRKQKMFRKASLVLQLTCVLKANLSGLELAEEASRLTGGRDFETWVEDQR